MGLLNEDSDEIEQDDDWSDDEEVDLITVVTKPALPTSKGRALAPSEPKPPAVFPIIKEWYGRARPEAVVPEPEAPRGPISLKDDALAHYKERLELERRGHRLYDPTDEQLAQIDAFEWQGKANCMGVDPDMFFPERGASTREAKEVCRGCVVREDCLEYALANGEKHGIWGGMSERERRRIRRSRAFARRALSKASEETEAIQLTPSAVIEPVLVREDVVNG